MFCPRGFKVWPAHQWNREVLLQLFESEFADIGPDLSESLQAYAGSFFSSLVCEELFNQNRRAADCNAKGAHELGVVWHHPATGSAVLSNFGRPSLAVSSAARSCA